MKTRIVLCMIVVIGFGGFAFAAPTLNELVPTEAAILHSGVGQVFLTDVPNGTSVANLVLENAAYESAFGIYNPDDPSKTLELFKGGSGGSEAGVFAITEVAFDQGTGLATITSSHIPGLVGDSEEISSNFGFYLDPDNNAADRLYTEGDGLIYQPEDAGYVYVAFEDDVDGDYNDFVVRVSDVAAVPAPGAIFLSSIGMSIVGWLKRRKDI